MRPMLAATADEEIIRKHLEEVNLLVSPKLDGIRGLVKDGVLVSRSLKPIRNTYVQAILGRLEFEGLDGELICGDPTAADCFRRSTSAFMSFNGEPDFQYHVFDKCNLSGGFAARYREVAFGYPYSVEQIITVPHKAVCSFEEVLEYEQECLEDGFEGIILRRPDMPYKFNRSTKLEGGMLKLKRFKDGEAKILGVEELFHNANVAEVDNLGFTKRGSAKDGKIPMDTMGKLVVRDLETEVEFKVGTGFSAEERQSLWDSKDALIGKIVKYKYLPVGVKDKPRHPVYLGMRSTEDMS